MAKERLVSFTAKNLDKIRTDGNYRQINEKAVEELMDSIKELGIREPITVKEDGDSYFLVSGYHRVEAVRRIIASHGHFDISIKAIVMSDEEDPYVRMVIANSLRSESVLDKASGAAKLLESGMSIKQICDAMGGKERMTIDNWLKLYKLMEAYPDFVRMYADKGKDSALYKLSAKFARDKKLDIVAEEKSLNKTKSKDNSEAKEGDGAVKEADKNNEKGKTRKNSLQKIVEEVLSSEGIEKSVIASVLKRLKEATKS